jgi:hypothetical protein
LNKSLQKGLFRSSFLVAVGVVFLTLAIREIALKGVENFSWLHEVFTVAGLWAGVYSLVGGILVFVLAINEFLRAEEKRAAEQAAESME